MEYTLRENLQRLISMQISKISLARPSGNGLSQPLWEITLCQTPGGEQFRFVQIDPIGRSGSGLYYPTIRQAEAYAQEVVKYMFLKADSFAKFGVDTHPNEYDWYPQGGLAEVF